MKHFFTIALLLFSFSPFAQTCDCYKDLLWVKKTFEENDAGFQFVIQQKGEDAYYNHNDSFLEKAKTIVNSEECTKTLYEWLKFFRTGHIGIRRLNPSTNSGNANDTTSNQADDWEKVTIDLEEFETYIKSRTTADMEGVWEVAPSYKVGIKRVDGGYVGFIISSGNSNWKEKQVKVRFDSLKGGLMSTYFMGDRSPSKSGNVKLIGKNYLVSGDFLFRRVLPELEEDQGIEEYYTSIGSPLPTFKKLNSTTSLLRIPSFARQFKPMIDSLLTVNSELLSQTKNLIIDIRNNGGGNDRSFSNILPLLYTNPIRTVGVEYWSSAGNIDRLKEFSVRPNIDENTRQFFENGIQKMSAHLGEFVNLWEDNVRTLTYDVVEEYPRNVAILINRNNASSAEQFLLAARQSKKVKLFGETTRGVLDISNMIFVKSPCGEFELGYSLSRSMRIPHMAIDDRGIQPDYFLDESIPNYKWWDYVIGILNR